MITTPKIEKISYGVTLVEVIVSLLLLAIIGVFGGMFLGDFIEGYLLSSSNSAHALTSQIAQERIRVELLGLNGTDSGTLQVSVDSSIRYTSATLPGTRSISFDAATRKINMIVDGASSTLIDNIRANSFSLNATDLGSKNGYVDLSFGYADIPGLFSVRVVPLTVTQQSWLEVRK